MISSFSIPRRRARWIILIATGAALGCTPSSSAVTSSPASNGVPPDPPARSAPVDPAAPREREGTSDRNGASPGGEAHPEPQLTPLGYALVERGLRPPWEAPMGDHGVTGPVAASSPGVTWQLERTIRVGAGYLHRALPTPDGTGLVVLSTRDGGLRYYDRASGELRRRVDLPEYVEFEDADFAIIGGQAPRAIVIRESGVVSYDLAGASAPRALELPAGDGLEVTARAGLWGFVRREVPAQTGALWLRWLAEDGTSTSALALSTSERPDSWSLSNDGRRLAVNYYPSNLTQVLDLERSEVLVNIPAPEWGGNVAFAPSGRYLALGGAHLALHAVPDGRLLAKDEAFGNNISDVRFTPDGELLLVGAHDGKVRSYALPPAGEAPQQLPSPQMLRHARQANINALGLSRDGRLLVTPSGDKTIKVWVR